jgi:hypothetical protein
MIKKSPTSSTKLGYTANRGRVGIVFRRGNDLWIDSTPVSEAENYGALRTHAKGHPDYWEELQSLGAAPVDEEYDEVSRGRVNYDTRKKVYLLFIDRCIRERPEMVLKIVRAMNLPPEPATEISGDSHYICPACRQGSEDEDADW